MSEGPSFFDMYLDSENLTEAEIPNMCLNGLEEFTGLQSQ